MELIQLSAGRGPLECSYVVYHVIQKLTKEARSYGISVSVVDTIADVKKNTYKSAILAVDGDTLTEFLKKWIGTIQWTEKSPFRPKHKRKNWFIQIETIEMSPSYSFDQNDIHIETFKASGPGGQHVNKTESAIRITHKPSGICVVSSQERSQYRNKLIALQLVQKRLENLNNERQNMQEADHWQNHNLLIRGNPIRKFVGIR